MPTCPNHNELSAQHRQLRAKELASCFSINSCRETTTMSRDAEKLEICVPLNPPPPSPARFEDCQTCRQTHSQQLWIKEYSVNAERPQQKRHASVTADTCRAGRGRLGLFSPEIIQQHGTPFTQSTEHETPLPIKVRHKSVS